MEFQQSGERDINKKTWKHCGGRGILLSSCSIFFLATNSLRVLNFYSFTTTNFLPSTKTICSKIFLLTSFSVFSVFYFLHLYSTPYVPSSTLQLSFPWFSWFFFYLTAPFHLKINSSLTYISLLPYNLPHRDLIYYNFNFNVTNIY